MQSDILILDSPPALAVADAGILAAHCSGVVVVIDSGRTRTDACRRALQTLEQTGGKIYGVVLNKLKLRRSGGSYSYYYYYAPDDQKRKQGTKRPVDQTLASKS
jgi:Mrp family chromosome partitioning ATPase